MKPALQLRLGQSLALTPQLQQAIRLLQLSRLELEIELNLALESNPLLDMSEEPAEGEEGEEGEDEGVGEAETAEQAAEAADSADADDQPLDLEFDRTEYRGTALDEDGIELQDAEPEDLRDHLLWQLNLTPMSGRDRAIAAAIIEAIDDDGYLAESDDGICETLASLHTVTPAEVASVRRRVQQFDPLGVASRSLKECLGVQLEAFAEGTPG